MKDAASTETQTGAAAIAHVRVACVRTAVATEAELLDAMTADCHARRAGRLTRCVTVLDVNGQGVSLYATDPHYAATLEDAGLVHADGQFIVWMSRLFAETPIPERTATTDFIHAAAGRAAREGLSFYLLGATEEVNAACARKLEADYPGLRIAGRRNGYFAPEDEAGVIADINASGADILWCGLGKPKEQVFVTRHRDSFACGWAVTSGGCFNFVTGAYRRAPVWMQRAGLEWLHRMATGPSYLVRRYALTIPHAIWLAFACRLRRGRGGPA